MTIETAMNEACHAIGIVPPRGVRRGEWVKTPVVGKGRGNGSGRVLIFDDGKGGICWNWVSGQEQRFTADGLAEANEARAPRKDAEAERRAAQEQAEVARICEAIVKAATPQQHAYLAAKGFPEGEGLVLDDPRPLIPAHDLGQAIVRALPEGEGPWLIVPGRIGPRVTTVQFIGPDGVKKNIYRGKMQGAAHRIATGRETWVCEGIATAMSVRAALSLLGRSATVFSAFSAANVAAVAQRHEGSIIAADHDKPLPQLHDMGTGEFYARKTGHVWTHPPMMGDFNDWHARDGIRAVAVHLKGVRA